jgi:small nuclear ribonucleoprotein E
MVLLSLGCGGWWIPRSWQNLIFRFLQSKARIQIWLFEQKDLRIEGRIIVSSLTGSFFSQLLN